MSRPALALAALLLAGCGSARRGEPLVGPIPLRGEAAAGEVVYMHVCNGCHPRGQAGVGPSLNEKPIPSAAIKLQIRTGLGGSGAMPAFPPEVLSDAQIDQITAYLTAIR